MRSTRLLFLAAGLAISGTAYAQPNERPTETPVGVRTEWLITASPVGVSHTQRLSDRVGVGVILTGPVFGLALGNTGHEDPSYVASAALALEFATAWITWRVAPAAVVLTGNDWGQVYPGYHMGARTYVGLGRVDLAIGVELVGVRIAGGHGTGDWQAKIGPFLGVRL